MVRIMIVSDIRLYRQGLAQVLAEHERLGVVQTAAGSDVARGRLEPFAPDVVLLDTGVEDALSLVRVIGDRSAAIRVVALGLSEIEQDVLAFAEAGISGYLCRDASVDELVKVVESVMKEELYCSRKIAGALLRRVAVLALDRGEPSGEVHLTRREFEVVSLLDQGLTNKEIARDLGIELTTVKNHVHNILDKLGVHTRGEAVAKVRALHRYGLSELRSRTEGSTADLHPN